MAVICNVPNDAMRLGGAPMLVADIKTPFYARFKWSEVRLNEVGTRKWGNGEEAFKQGWVDLKDDWEERMYIGRE